MRRTSCRERRPGARCRRPLPSINFPVMITATRPVHHAVKSLPGSAPHIQRVHTARRAHASARRRAPISVQVREHADEALHERHRGRRRARRRPHPRTGRARPGRHRRQRVTSFTSSRSQPVHAPVGRSGPDFITRSRMPSQPPISASVTMFRRAGPRSRPSAFAGSAAGAARARPIARRAAGGATVSIALGYQSPRQNVHACAVRSMLRLPVDVRDARPLAGDERPARAEQSRRPHGARARRSAPGSSMTWARGFLVCRQPGRGAVIETLLHPAHGDFQDHPRHEGSAVERPEHDHRHDLSRGAVPAHRDLAAQGVER